MKITNLFRKTLIVPQSNDTKEIPAVQLWSVRWCSRYGEYSSNIRAETEVFTSEEDAKEFQLALQNAFKLIKHTSNETVTLTKEQ